MKKTAALLMLLAALPFAAAAGQGEVCTSVPVSLTASARNPMQIVDFNNKTEFDCPTAGKVTIQQLYAKGWRVAHMAPMVTHSPELAAQAAKQPVGVPFEMPMGASMPHMAIKLIIEKP